MTSPFTNQFPYWVWASTKYTRKGKDIWEPICKIIEKSRIYDLALKRMSTYIGFSVFVGITWSFCHGRVFDRLWCYWNRGHLYHDNIYVYPPEEEEDDED